MSQQQANAAIAKRLWPNAKIECLPAGGWVNVLIYDKPDETRSWHGFDAFTDEAAARELVQHFNNFRAESAAFVQHIAAQLRGGSTSYTEWMLVTPRQKALAACKAWGIELEQEKENA